MAITDELRHNIEGAEQLYGYEYKRFRAIADRIDSEHEEALREAYTKGREDGMGVANRADMRAEYLRGKNDGWDEGYDEGFASADDWCSQHEDEMEKHGWVKLPKDANGEVIHLGDVVMLPDWPLCHHEVINLVYAHDGWAIISRHGSIEASEHTVHVKPKKPTVEDVLTEFARECLTYATCVEDHEVTDAIELYAPKLRLAGDAE